MVESSDDAIVSKDLNGTIVTWNAAAERMFGYPAAEAIGQSIRLIIPADRQAEEDTVLATIRAGRAVSHFETMRQRKDGTMLPISLSVSPIRDASGTVVGASKIARDITTQREAAFAMQRLAAVVASSDDAIVTKDLAGTITSWNPAAERMFGYTESEAIGRSVRMLIPPELQGEEDGVLARLRAGLGVDHYETVRQRKDGRRLSISLSVSPIRDEAGTVVAPRRLHGMCPKRSASGRRPRARGDYQKLADVGAALAASLDRDDAFRGDRHRHRAHHRRVRRVLLQRRRRPVRRGLPDRHAVGAVGRNEGGLRAGRRPAALAIFPPAFTATRRATHRCDRRSHFVRHPRSGPAPGHPPVRSYLAVPVRAARAQVVGGFFGHPEPDRFTEQHERIALGIAGWASVALENRGSMSKRRRPSDEGRVPGRPVP